MTNPQKIIGKILGDKTSRNQENYFKEGDVVQDTFTGNVGKISNVGWSWADVDWSNEETSSSYPTSRLRIIKR